MKMKKGGLPAGMVSPGKAADIQNIADKLSKLPHDQLMYVAGAIHMAATLPINTGQDQKGA